MRWIYILIVLVIAAAALGCVDKKETQSTTQTSVPQGDAKITSPGETAPEISTASNGEDVFGTESDLGAMNTTFSDMNMEISLLDSI